MSTNNLIHNTVDWVLEFIKIAIFARIILSWIPISKENKIIRFLYEITEPILAPIRGMLEKSAMVKNSMIDFSPIVAFMLLYVVEVIVDRIF
jgi:YggT family protein